MKIKIKFLKEENKISISFKNNFIDVYLNEEDKGKNVSWNTKGINDFLIELISATPNGDKIIIDYSDDEKNESYNHIVLLFKSFINEFNRNDNLD